MKTTLGGYPKIFNIESDPREERSTRADNSWRPARCHWRNRL
jgi:hypothetical protein